MIKMERERAIVGLLAERREMAIGEIAACLGHVSAITVRRDVARLAERGLIGRTHGGAQALRPRQTPADEMVGDELAGVDAIVLPPIEGRGANTLRLSARRRGIPFLAESAPQEGGVYLGPDNFLAGQQLGSLAGERFAPHREPRVLLVTLQDLPNTRARCEGFLAGFTESVGRSVTSWRVDGNGRYHTALRVAMDAFATHPDINLVFGVNDHSILGALEAAERLGIEDVAGYSVGGEGTALFDALDRGGRMVACAALFPDIVGMRAVDVLADALAGAPMPGEVRTPHAILDRAGLGDYYQRDEAGWLLRPEVLLCLLAAPARPTPRVPRGRRIGFLPHYPAHDWYRNMTRAMEARARERGLGLKIAAPQAGIAREIRDLRRLIVAAAVHRVAPGDTIVVNAGACALMFAEALSQLHGVTVVSNSLDVLERLNGQRETKVILTSGEYQAASRCLVGPSLGALFETLRVDKAFLSVDGISRHFGLSSTDERLALAARRFIHASRTVVVLADHSLVGLEATHRIAPADAASELITDSGSLPADRLAFASIGLRVTLADASETEDLPLPRTRYPTPPAGRP